ncbi:MAG: SDR family NAD(P)-dependent oxidoreductase, partial [Spirochaetia bacterium]|nr:SDR family NAD(P)-dependent oxidoreductase [Spirochaetia bacterium]
MSSFKNKTVFITGASSGIGAALAREFALRGAKVGLVARRSDRIETIADEITGAGGKAAWAVGDVTKDGSLEKAAAKIRKSLGLLDAVVANAGFSVVGDVAELTLADFRRQLETNTFGVLRTIYATL